MQLAYDYLGEAALMDLDDIEHNTRDGLHMASLAGSWIALVCGLGGMRDHNGILTFAPRLPDRISRLAFGIRWRGSVLRVEVGPDSATYRVTSGDPVPFGHHGERLEASTDKPVTAPIPKITPLTPAPPQPAHRRPARRDSSPAGHTA